MFRIALRLLAALSTVALISGCAGNYYNIPKETYVQKVRNLGVLPILTDPGSDIRSPQKDEIVALVREFNRKNEKTLISGLRDTGSYFTVTPSEADPAELFEKLYFRRELRDDAGVVYNKYFYKQQEIRDMIAKSGVDAVLVVVVSGITKRDKVFSGNLLKFLEGDYNSLIVTAQILDGEGTILWEYPNFRQVAPSLPVFLPLQYPDFDEAEANLDDKVAVKFRTAAGLRRALERQSKDYLFRTTGTSLPYQKVFDDIIALLRPEYRLFGEKEEKPAAREPAVKAEQAPAPAVKTETKPAPAPQSAAPAPAPAPPAAQAAPAQQTPPPAPAPAPKPELAPAPAEKPLGKPAPIIETPIK